MAWPHEKVARPHNKTARPHKQIARPHKKIARLHEKIARLHEKIARLHEKIARLHEKMARVIGAASAWHHATQKQFLPGTHLEYNRNTHGQRRNHAMRKQFWRPQRYGPAGD